MKKLFVIVFVLVALFVPVTAIQATDIPNGKVIARMDNVVKVFMHLPGDYSVITPDNNEYKVVRLWQWAHDKANSAGVSTFLGDVVVKPHLIPTKSKSYVEVVKTGGSSVDLNIYVESLDLFSGGGFQVKCGKGCTRTEMTQVVK